MAIIEQLISDKFVAVGPNLEPSPAVKTTYINNRRYLGNKYKLLPLIKSVVDKNCDNVDSVADIFAEMGAAVFDIVSILLDYMTTKEAAGEWGAKIRQVQLLCEKGQVKNAKRLGHMWAIPRGTKKPVDGRTKKLKSAGGNHNG